MINLWNVFLHDIVAISKSISESCSVETTNLGFLQICPLPLAHRHLSYLMEPESGRWSGQVTHGLVNRNFFRGCDEHVNKTCSLFFFFFSFYSLVDRDSWEISPAETEQTFKKEINRYVTRWKEVKMEESCLSLEKCNLL